MGEARPGGAGPRPAWDQRAGTVEPSQRPGGSWWPGRAARGGSGAAHPRPAVAPTVHGRGSPVGSRRSGPANACLVQTA